MHATTTKRPKRKRTMGSIVTATTISAVFLSSCSLAHSLILPHPSSSGRIPTDLSVSSISSWAYSDYVPVAEIIPQAFGFQDYMDVLVQRAPKTPTTVDRAKTAATSKKWKVFCDLDGVLVDFEAGINRVFPNEPGIHHVDDSFRRKAMWRQLEASGNFFEVFPWTDCGKSLWQAILPLEPDILTGCPSHASSRTEKYNWCTRELGIPLVHIDKAGKLFQHYHVNNGKSNHNGHQNNNNNRSSSRNANRVITCWSYNKHHESGPNRVLIDDRESLREAWEAKGGVFIHHNGDLRRTLMQMVEHGILCPQKLGNQGLL